MGGYFLYYLLCKNEDLTRGLIVPIIVIVCPCVWALNGSLSMNDRSVLFLGIFDNALASVPGVLRLVFSSIGPMKASGKW